ncbi:MAG: thiol:disulfide interchange protein DsbA/DsbL [Gammaproteobacteria bacterium]|nr:thiol:disulfide interchange protein DsbA/DsbL [Gammaproteobacteria bacterium]
MRILLLCLLFSLSLTVNAAKSIEINEGIEYQELDKPQAVKNKDKIEVIEFFSYACPHCYNLEPHVEDWLSQKKDDVEFIRLPAIFNKNWEAFAGIYYTAQTLGVVDKVHSKIFNSIHGSGKKIKSLDDIKELFVSIGIKAEDFDNTVKSFNVANLTRKAKQMTKSYAIKSVPMIIVNGKYRTDSTLANGHKNVFTVVEHIVDQERKK